MTEKTENDKHYWQLVDTFIGIANDKAQTIDRSIIGPSLLYSASRFNAYMLSAVSPTVEAFNENKEAAIKYYLAQHEEMMRENFDDFAANFDKYRNANS
ncbi:DUF3144 domain-containing protein [Rugamonas rubra]|uniref:DUF3144 domain-containing protein n=1 Tax=Rugamonas rubra TaxID=758825 RepID=A0A1I4JP55_9BURK|nr:DUF3144 domain-containing protein [Rugamonas rubra]SFL68319.1 Protein of unknown function [Rugamonas rubra]